MNIKEDSALLLIDLLTDFKFEDGDKLFKNTVTMLNNLQKVKESFMNKDRPVFYVNDPINDVDDSFDKLRSQLESTDKGRYMLNSIGPQGSESLLIKPQRSGFFETELENYLDRQKVKHIYVTGVTTDICVLFTAHDGYMRNFKVSVPSDCVAAVEDEFHNDALRFLARVAEADISPMVI